MTEEIVLELNEAIRKRPAMYIGSTSIRGFVNLFRGSIIHMLNRFNCEKFSFELLGGLKAKIEILVSKQRVSDSFVTDVWNDSPTSLGHEIVALNALSKTFQFEVFDKKNNKLLTQIFKKGEAVSGQFTNKNYVAERIEIAFELDDSIFDMSHELNANFFLDELRKFAYLNKRNTLEIKYLIGDEKCRAIFHSEHGLKDLIEVERVKGHVGTYLDTYFEKQFDHFFVECAFAFRETRVDESFLDSYVNDEYTHENGSHIDGLLKGITYGVMKHFQKHELTQKYKISEKGILDELVAAIHIRMKNAQFSGCVKNKLASPEIIEPLAEYISELLFQKIESNVNSKDKLIRKFAI